MLRRWFSSWIRKNKNKFINIGSKLIIVAIVVFIATIIVSMSERENIVTENQKKTYKPKETIIKGYEVSDKQYELDTNLINKFLEYCNDFQPEKAYDLLSKECKEYIYPTLEIFKNSYYNPIFKEKKLYNLQAWITTSKYTIYKIRYTNNILSTGEYDKNQIYNDYITLTKNQEIQNISIGSFVASEELNVTTLKEDIKFNVTKKNIYLEDEEYEIYVQNNSPKTILLDNLENNNTIKLITNTDDEHQAYMNQILNSNLIIKPGYTKKVTIKFKKSVSNSRKSEYIEFLKVIKDYDKYIQDKENYNDTINLKINI